MFVCSMCWINRYNCQSGKRGAAIPKDPALPSDAMSVSAVFTHQ